MSRLHKWRQGSLGGCAKHSRRGKSAGHECKGYNTQVNHVRAPERPFHLLIGNARVLASLSPSHKVNDWLPSMDYVGRTLMSTRCQCQHDLPLICSGAPNSPSNLSHILLIPFQMMSPASNYHRATGYTSDVGIDGMDEKEIWNLPLVVNSWRIKYQFHPVIGLVRQ